MIAFIIITQGFYNITLVMEWNTTTVKYPQKLLIALYSQCNLKIPSETLPDIS